MPGGLLLVLVFVLVAVAVVLVIVQAVFGPDEAVRVTIDPHRLCLRPVGVHRLGCAVQRIALDQLVAVEVHDSVPRFAEDRIDAGRLALDVGALALGGHGTTSRAHATWRCTGKGPVVVITVLGDRPGRYVVTLEQQAAVVPLLQALCQLAADGRKARRPLHAPDVAGIVSSWPSTTLAERRAARDAAG